MENAVSDGARVSTSTVDVFVRENLFPVAISSAKRRLEVAAREERGMVAWGNTNTQVRRGEGPSAQASVCIILITNVSKTLNTYNLYRYKCIHVPGIYIPAKTRPPIDTFTHLHCNAMKIIKLCYEYITTSFIFQIRRSGGVVVEMFSLYRPRKMNLRL